MEFLEIPIFDGDIFELLVRFTLNAIFLALIVSFAIYRSQRDEEFTFTAVMMNVTAFFICFVLKDLELGIGMALGLFAVFAVLRYRTDVIRPKEMTYLFIVIGIAVINALSNENTSYAEVVTVNLLIVVTALLKERFVAHVQQRRPTNEKLKTNRHEYKKYAVKYDKIAWLGPEYRAQLLADLRQRTGTNVRRVQIKNIDLKRSTATLAIWCNDQASASEQKT